MLSFQAYGKLRCCFAFTMHKSRCAAKSFAIYSRSYMLHMNQPGALYILQPQSIAYTDGCLHAGLAVTSTASSCLQPTSSSGFRRHHTSQSRTHHLPVTQAICKHAPLHLLKHQHRPHHRPGRPKALVSCHASSTFYPATHPATHCCIGSGC